MSRLFIGLDLDTSSHEKFSKLDFQIPRKAVAAEVDDDYEDFNEIPRGRAVDISERAPAPRTRSLGTRAENQIHVETRVDHEAWPLVEDDAEYCGVCGGTHGLIWKCGRKLERVVTQKMEKPTRKWTKRERVAPRVRRESTMRRIRQRVARALTV